MEFYRISGNRLGLREIPPLLASLMRQIPGPFEQDCKAAEERLFPRPSQDPRRASTSRGLESACRARTARLFPSARQVVEADLRGFRE